MHYSRTLRGFGALLLASLLASNCPLWAVDEKPETEKNEAAPTAPAAATNRVEGTVVKVFSTQRAPDLSKPWTKAAPREVTGSGVIIDGKRILTNAHVVLYASQVQVQANQSGNKISAKVEAINQGIDLAILKLEDESLFDTQQPLPRASGLPSVKDTVMVYGFPTGGSSLSITKGIISRIEFANYHYPTSGMRIQIDAAINPGNSGGPAVVDDKLIGLAYSRLGGAQGIGYIIPIEEIELFLKDVADGKVDGKGKLFDEFQKLENLTLRAYLKLDKTVEGVVLHDVDSGIASQPLKRWDILTKIGGTPIDNEGKVKVGDNLRVSFLYLIQRFSKNGAIDLTIIRDGKEQTVSVPVERDRARLIPFLSGAYPEYFICGPIAFSVATEEFVGALTGGTNSLAAYTALSMMQNPLVTRRNERPSAEAEQLVVIPAPFFPHKLSKGYANPGARVVETVNDIPIKSLRHLVEVIRDAKGEFLTIEFAGRSGEALVFPRQEMIASTEEILNDNGVRSQASPELLKVWNAKKE